MSKVLCTPDLRSISSPARALRSPGRGVQSIRSPARGGRVEDVMAGSHSNVSQWRKACSTAARAEMQSGVREVHRERARLEDLRTELHCTAELLQVVRHDQAETSQRCEAMRETAAASARRVELIERTRDQLSEAHERQLQELSLEEDALEQKREGAEQRKAEFEGFLSMYKDKLGLAVTIPAAQTVRLTFTLIDPADRAREFSFSLGLALEGKDSSDTYSVSGCSPSIPNLRALLQCLNAEADTDTALPAFMCGMRKAFKRVATGGPQKH